MKLFVSDLDGTLLDAQFGISERNRSAIERLAAAGVTFAVATGRAYRDANDIVQRYGLCCPIICNNGACLYGADGTLLEKSALTTETLGRLCAYLEENNIFYGINSLTEINVLRDWETVLGSDMSQQTAHCFEEIRRVFLSQKGLRYLENFQEFRQGERDACSISVMSLSHHKLEQLAEFVKGCEGVLLTVSGYSSLELAAGNSSKADALRHLAAHLEIPMEQVVAIGDNYNDVDMLATAGVSFAMGNAPPDIQQVATYVTADCYSDGVAVAIEQILDGGK